MFRVQSFGFWGFSVFGVLWVSGVFGERVEVGGWEVQGF